MLALPTAEAGGGCGCGRRGGVHEHEGPARPAVQRVRVRPAEQRQLRATAHYDGRGEQAARAARGRRRAGQLKAARAEREQLRRGTSQRLREQQARLPHARKALARAGARGRHRRKPDAEHDTPDELCASLERLGA